MGQTFVFEFCQVESTKGLKQPPRMVDRTEPQPGFELVNIAAEQRELEANRVRIGFIFDQEIDDRQKFMLPLVACTVGDDNVAYFAEGPQ